MYLCSLLCLTLCHPVWDISLIMSNESETESDINNLESYPDLNNPEDNHVLMSIIDGVISGRMRIKCATEQGQEGKCIFGKCDNLGDTKPSVCPGILSPFLKCCPNEKVAEVVPVKLHGNFVF